MTDSAQLDALQLLLAANRHWYETRHQYGNGPELRQASAERNAVIGIALELGVTPGDVRAATDTPLAPIKE